MSEHLAVCLWLLSVLVLIRARSVCWLQRLCSDFRSVVLVRTLLGALNRLLLPVTSLFWRTLRGIYYYGQAVLPLSWIHSKIVSAPTVRIIGLTNTAKIVFLLLDWIYLSIRIMMILYTEHKPKKKNNGRTVKDVYMYICVYVNFI